jgi:hypothetical protein
MKTKASWNDDTKLDNRHGLFSVVAPLPKESKFKKKTSITNKPTLSKGTQKENVAPQIRNMLSQASHTNPRDNIFQKVAAETLAAGKLDQSYDLSLLRFKNQVSPICSL